MTIALITIIVLLLIRIEQLKRKNQPLNRKGTNASGVPE